MAKKILIITYYWPPSGGAGVQRWLKFSKYLPAYGWEPYILTVDPRFAAYPAQDESLGNEVQMDVKIFRTPAINYFKAYSPDSSRIPTAGFANSTNITLREKIFRFIRGNFFIPDPRRGWNKYAFKKACSIIKEENIQIVITTSPPHSTQLIGLKIKKCFPDIKWLADLRDPWSDIYYYKDFYPSFLAASLDSWYERSVLKEADRIITVGMSLKKAFSSKQKGIAEKISVITNGYDENDFTGRKKENSSRFTITYVGTIADKYPIKGFLKALEIIKHDGSDFLFRLVGTVPAVMLDELRKKISEKNIEHIPYTSHNKAIGYMMDSSMLLLIIPEHKSNTSIITGKIFEYIATQNPVLCLGPVDGDAASILKFGNFGKTYDYKNSEEIAAYINSNMNEPEITKYNTLEFSHKNLTKKLVSSLEDTLKSINKMPDTEY